MIAPEVSTAAQQILDGDSSTRAAASLELALHTYHPYEEEFEDLLEAIALYNPGMGSPYTDHQQLCDAIRQSSIFASDEGSD